MPKETLTTCLGLALCFAVLAGPCAAAQEREAEGERPQAEQQDEQAEPAVSRRRAAEIVQERYAGRVLGLRLEGRRWRVRMDNEGTVFNVFVDAESGVVVEPEETEE